MFETIILGVFSLTMPLRSVHKAKGISSLPLDDFPQQLANYKRAENHNAARPNRSHY